MTAPVFLVVLGAALMHATWNALIKSRLDRYTAITLMTFGIGTASLICLPFAPPPPPPVWLFILISSGAQNGDRFFLAKAYEAGDLAQTYALARGTAPLIVALGGIALLNEAPSPFGAAGILLLCGGTLTMSLRGGSGALRNRAVPFSLLTSLFIAAYTLADGHGARLASDALSYTVWLFAFDAAVLFLACTGSRREALFRAPPREWMVAGIAGIGGAGSYGIAVWAMTKAPVASVAALRETSILFAMAISVLLLGERLTAWRVFAALLIVAGMASLRLA